MTDANFFHDVWVALIALTKGELRAVEEPLVRYRQHGGNVVGTENSAGLPPVMAIAGKCLKALRSRQSLENAWFERTGGGQRKIFSGGFDLGLGIFVRTMLWTVFSSSGYLRIGLQLSLGKFLWDLGFRRVGSSQNRRAARDLDYRHQL